MEVQGSYEELGIGPLTSSGGTQFCSPRASARACAVALSRAEEQNTRRRSLNCGQRAQLSHAESERSAGMQIWVVPRHRGVTLSHVICDCREVPARGDELDPDARECAEIREKANREGRGTPSTRTYIVLSTDSRLNTCTAGPERRRRAPARGAEGPSSARPNGLSIEPAWALTVRETVILLLSCTR